MNEETRRMLLSAARAAVEAALARAAPPVFTSEDEVLRTPRGVFVSVHVGDALRGCIGVVLPASPLLQSVMSCAVSAATGDQRFPPLEPAELGRAVFEISVLTPPVVVRRLDEIIVGTHGLILAHRGRAGLLLPQVATRHGMTAERFLDAVCVKAGLAEGTWKLQGVRLERFTAEVFAEAPAAP